MNRRMNTLPRFAVLGAATSLFIGMGMAPALAADDSGVAVTNTETIQVLMDSNANVKSQRVYEQIDLSGKGNVNFANPIETNSLRNLDGFKGFDVKDGNQIVKAQVDGEKRFRTVSDYKKDLPVKISVRYFLDGQPIEAGDVVGKSGKLGIYYKVENRTGETQTLSYLDGKGNTIEKEENVAIPMVGSLTTVAPSNFTDVASKQANMAGDGRGATQLSFTMTLFPPIGSNVAEFGYEADVKDAVVPKASISMLPINPLESPSFAGGAASYKGGAETGQKLTAGAATIDENLLKLRDGANELVAGLIQLRDGAGLLSAGLNNEAAPGANKLAAGAGKLDAGAGKIADGADDLNGGSAKLRAGAGDLVEGTNKLRAGVKPLAAGLEDAAGKAPALVAGLDLIKAGTDKLESNLVKMLDEAVNPAISGIGTTSPGETILYAVTAVRQGLAGAKAQLDPKIAGIPASQQGLNCASLILKDITTGAPAPGACFPPGNVRPPTLTVDSDPTRNFVLSSMATQLGDGATNLGTMKTSLDGLSAGLGDAVTNLYKAACGLDFQSNPGVCDLAKPGILQALQGIKGGIGEKTDFDVDDNPLSLRAGVYALGLGADLAKEGSQALVDGLVLMNDGVNDEDGLVDGIGQLDDGAGKLADGTVQLDDGTELLAAGADTLKGGTGELSAGASKLAAGLGDAASGSGELFDGLMKAAASAPAIPEGAEQLSKEGTSMLVLAGNTTAMDYGNKYALIEAGAERAQASGMAYGAPAEAQGLTAYKFELAGDDGEGSRTTTRGLAALALFAAGGALAFFRRPSLV